MHGDLEREAKAWLEKLAEADRKQSGFQDMAAEGHLAPSTSYGQSSLASRRPASSPSTSLRYSKDASLACENLSEMQMRC
jgi:hypothetical protein